MHPFFAGSEHALWPLRLPRPAHAIAPCPSAFPSPIKTRIAPPLPSSKHTAASSKRWSRRLDIILITQRTHIPRAGALQERVKVADREDLRLAY